MGLTCAHSPQLEAARLTRIEMTHHSLPARHAEAFPIQGRALRALTLKIINGANDVIDEGTQNGGREIWTRKSWNEFIPLLKKWMLFWEETGRRHGHTR